MDGFSKVRTGIAGLKKDREDLKRNYDFLAKEIERIVSENAKTIKELTGKSETLATSVAAIEERLGKTDGSIDSTRTTLYSEINGIQKRMDGHKKKLTELGERLQKATDAAGEAARRIGESRQFEKDMSKTVSGIGAGVSGLEQKLRTMEKSVSESLSSIDGKFISGISVVNRTSEEQSSLLKDHDSAIQRLTLSMQSLKKDLEKENERIARVKESATKNAARLEQIGTLQSKIKHIEDVKSGLVRGVESIKSIKTDMAALEQKTRGVQSKLTDADRFLESRLLEKTKTLDSQIAEKADAMEYQLAEQLKLLEANLVKKNNEIISKINVDITGLGRDVAAVSKTITLVKADHAATKKRLLEIESLRQRIRDVEKLGNTLSGNIAEIKTVQKQVAALGKQVGESRIKMEDVNAAIDSKIDYNISELKKDTAFTSATLARLDEELKKSSLNINSLRKDTASNSRGLTGLKANFEKIEKKAADLEKLQIKLGDMGDAKAALTQAMETKLEQRIKFIETELRQKADNIEISLSERSGAVEAKLGKDIAAIKKELTGKEKSIDSVKTRLEKIAKLEERLRIVDQEKDVVAKNVSSLQNLRTDMSKMDEKSRNLEREFRALKALTDSGFTELRGRVDTTASEEGNKFSTAVKAFLNARADLNKKISLLELKLSDSNRRVSDFSKLVTRIDLLEKKVDRLTEKGSQIRRDMDQLERKEDSDEKITVVDLGKEKELIDGY